MDAIGFDARQVQGVLDERRKAASRLLQHAPQVLARVLFVGRHQQISRAEHRLEGRSNFVAHRGQETTLRAIRFFRARPGLVQVGGTFGDAFFEMTIQVPKGALGADYTIRKQSRKRRQEHRERGRSDGRRFQDLMREQYIVQDGA